MNGYIPVRNKRIYYELYGKENFPTFLYLHGGPGVGSFDFNLTQAERLSPFIRLISIDQRGCLRSDAIGEDEDFGLQDLIDDFEAVRNYFGIERWGLIGHSFGGYLAVEYACRHPEVIEQMILECPSFDLIESLRSVVQKAEALYREDKQDEMADRCKEVYSYSEDEVFNVFNDISEKRDQVYIHALQPKFFDRIVEQSGISEAEWQKQSMFQHKLMPQIIARPNIDQLASISCPVLLIKGQYDPICSEYQTEQFMNNVRLGTIKVLNHSAHMPRHEEPELFAETVKSFANRWIAQAGADFGDQNT